MSYDKGFEGDLLLYEKDGSGEVLIEGGLFAADAGFATAAYLSLFGGNRGDSGGVQSAEQFWGNFLSGAAESGKLRSRFQHAIEGAPMTVKKIKEAQACAVEDLNWFVTEGVADEVRAQGAAAGVNRLSLKIEILKDKNLLFANEYFLSWGAHDGGAVSE